MDDGRFDILTRRLAAASTRRAPRRGLAGAALTAALMRLGLAEAAAKKKGKKGKNQCSTLAEPCTEAADCCGSLACRQSDNTCCTPLNAACSSSEECCLLGVCETNDDGEPRCCSPDGTFCNQARECCSFLCLPNHTCAPSDPTCLENGEDCEDSADCCSAFCPSLVGTEHTCCVPSKGACINDSDCCPLGSAGTACEFFSGANRCRVVEGSMCSFAVPCCPGLDCTFSGGILSFCE